MKNKLLSFFRFIKPDSFSQIVLALLPVLLFSFSASTALAAGICVLFSFLFVYSFFFFFHLFPALQRFRFPLLLLICAAAITVYGILFSLFFKELYSVMAEMLPLCGVSAFLLLPKEPNGTALKKVSFVFSNGGVFLVALLIVGCLRELLGAGTVFNKKILPLPMLVFALSCGAIFFVAVLAAIANVLDRRSANDA